MMQFLLLFFVIYGCLNLVSAVTTTCGGTAVNNSQCHFDFTYSSVNLSQCTYYGKTRPWCYVSNTTTNAQTSKWGYCDCDNMTPSPVSQISLNDSIPTWYAYTRALLSNGILKSVVIPIAFKKDNLTNDMINITYDDYYYTVESNNLYYLDSTWNKFTYNITFLNNTYLSNFSPFTVTVSELAMEAYKFASENENQWWCNGVCGRNDDYFQRLRIDDNNFDQIIILVTDQYYLGNTAFSGWAGLASIGTPKLWVKVGSFTPGVLEHEFGHNLGLYHQLSSKYQRIENTTKYGNIGVQYDGESRMGAGGSVYIDDQSSRFKQNGHFGPCTKDWHGWLNENTNIIDINFDDKTDITNDGIFTINAYDRPDIIPNDDDTIESTGSNTYLIRIKYGSEYEYYDNTKYNVIYIYYRTSYIDENEINNYGISVQYCMINGFYNSYPSGASIQTYTMDIHGDTYVQTDHYLTLNKSYVIQPFLWNMENNIFSDVVNPYQTKRNLLNVTMLEISDDWDKYCDKTTLICNKTVDDLPPNLSVKIKIEWIQALEDLEMPYYYDDYDYDTTTYDEIIEDTYFCNESESREYEITLSSYDDLYVAHIVNPNYVTGRNGRANFEFNVCGNDANIQAFIYDKFPFTVINNDITKLDDLGIGSIMTFSFIGNFGGCLGNPCKVQAVQVLQNEAKSLHIAEIQVFSQINGTNVANSSNCYSFPDVGVEPDLSDGDYGTFSHSTDDAKGSYDVCIFDEPIDIKQVKIWPRQSWWSRSDNLTLNLYEFATEGSTYSENDISLSNLVYSINVTSDGSQWDNLHKTFDIPSVNSDSLIEMGNCNENEMAKIPMIQGELYLVLKMSNYFENYGDTSKNVKLNFTVNKCEIEKCPINTWYDSSTATCQRCNGDDENALYYYNDVDGSTNSNDCQRCPYHRKLKDKENAWCDIEECQTVYITHGNGLGNQIDGFYYNLGSIKDKNDNNNTITKYLSYSLTKLIDYNEETNRFEIIDLANDSNIIAYSKTNDDSQYQYPFLLNDENDWYEDNIIYYDDIPTEKIQIIKITQRRNSTTVSYNTLAIAEIEFFAKENPSVNIAPLNATCFNLPINPTYYWYSGDDNTGIDLRLTDENLATEALNNDPNGADPNWCVNNNCTAMCILDEPIELSHIIIYPPQSNWRFYRTKELLIEFYNNGTILNNWNLNDSNVSNSIIDNNNLKFGQILYSNEQSISVNTTFNVSNIKIIEDSMYPLSIECPNRYAFDCQSLLDEYCEDSKVYKVIKSGKNNLDNNDISWYCINRTWLTNDQLNLKINYWDVSNYWSDLIYDYVYNIDSQVDSVVTECETEYGVNNVTNMECFENDNVFRCYLYEFENKYGNVIDIYDKLAMYVQFIAVQNVEIAVNNNEVYHFPIAGRVYVNGTSNVYSEIAIPHSCEGTWNIALTLDQTPIGGVKLDLFETSYIVENNNDNNNNENEDDYCVALSCDSIVNSVDSFNKNIFNKISYFDDIYDSYCFVNASSNELVSPDPTKNDTLSITTSTGTLSTTTSNDSLSTTTSNDTLPTTTSNDNGDDAIKFEVSSLLIPIIAMHSVISILILFF